MEEQINTDLIVKKKTNKVNVTFWIVAVLITAVSILYQNTTGPTYPKKGIILFLSYLWVVTP